MEPLRGIPVFASGTRMEGDHSMTIRSMPKLTDRDEFALRVFYASCGLSAQTIENAIEARRAGPAQDEAKAIPGKKKRGRHAVRGTPR
jgi:hypothetical protein